MWSKYLDAAAWLQQGKKVVFSEFYDEIIFQVKKPPLILLIKIKLRITMLFVKQRLFFNLAFEHLVS